MPIELVLLGAGGHAKVVYDAVLRGLEAGRVRVLDENPSLAGAAFFDLRVEAPPSDWGLLPQQVHVCVGENRARRRLGTVATGQGKTLLAIVHPAAAVAATAEVGPGAFVAAGAVIGPYARVGIGAIINHGAVVDHDCSVGEYAHIAPNATLGGGVRVGAASLIGACAVVLPGICIGDESVVGAGAVVTRDVAAGQTVIGAPARPI